MNNNKTYPRLVSWSYYPATAFIRNSKEILIEVYLDDSAGESILEKGVLPSLGSSMEESPYFTKKKIVGRTEKARTHGDLKRRLEKKYPELKDRLKSTDRKILDFGEYIFLDIPHIDNYVNPIVNDDQWYNSQYIKKEFFTIDFIKELIEYRPIALFNRKEITDFQAKKLPSFLRELKIFNEDLYKESIKGSRFEEEEINYSGLKAKLKTLKPGKVKYRLDISEEIFYWDGRELTKGNKLRDGSTIVIRPSDKVIVKIIDNNTVTDKTEFTS